MSPRHLHRRTDGARARERGAVLIQVALALTVLCGFCAMSIDFGLLMVARGQVQTAADAGALAGAIALGFDDDIDISGAKLSARAVAAANLVAQGSADVTDADVQVDTYSEPGFPQPLFQPTVVNRVAVSAYRNQARGNALPTFFGKLVGIGEQGVRATATALMVPSNASDCVWPLAVPDGWEEHTVPPAPTFVRYGPTGPPTLAPSPDVYRPPSSTPPYISHSTGFIPEDPTLPGNSSIQARFRLPLTLTNPWPLGPMNFTQNTERGRFVPVELRRHSDVGSFEENLRSCNNSDAPVTIGDRLNVEPTGTLGIALTIARERFAADPPPAGWNPITFRVENSCAGVPPCGPMSPRFVVLPVFDLNRYEDTRWVGGLPGATPEIRVVNFVGFFITNVTDTSIEGQLMIAPGRVVMGKPMVGYGSAFLRTTFLSR